MVPLTSATVGHDSLSAAAPNPQQVRPPVIVGLGSAEPDSEYSYTLPSLAHSRGSGNRLPVGCATPRWSARGPCRHHRRRRPRRDQGVRRPREREVHRPVRGRPLPQGTSSCTRGARTTPSLSSVRRTDSRPVSHCRLALFGLRPLRGRLKRQAPNSTCETGSCLVT